MKIRNAMKLALACLCVGLAVGAYVMWKRGCERSSLAAAAATYADLSPDFDRTAAPPGELAVDFRDDVAPSTVEEIGKALGVRFHGTVESRKDGVYEGDVDPAREAEVLAALRRDARVESAEEDFVMGIPETAPGALTDEKDEGLPDRHEAARGPAFPNDPRAGEQWHMEQVHMAETWPAANGEGVIVAVIDTGVAHVEDLAQTEFVPGWNFVANNDNADDDHGHGTHVAGTIAQSTHNGVGVTGIAYKAKIMPLKVLTASGSGSVAGIAQAVRWAANHGAKVINMSLGGPMNAQVLAKAVKYAHDKGVVVVCAAGNDGRGKVGYPAANAGAIAVAATQKDERTTFSNWGKQVAIAAPGGNTREEPAGGVLQNTRLRGSGEDYYFMGTSMASPHVAGIAALVVGAGVTDPDAVLAILQGSARMPAGMKDKPDDFAQHYGAGLIDAAAAVRKARLGTGATEAGTGAALALLAVVLLRRARKLGSFGGGGMVGVVLGASGLFFASFVPGLRGLATLPGAALLTHGFPAWDASLLGASGHGNPLFYSALVPVVALALLYGVKRSRGLLAGFAFGVAGHLLANVLVPSLDVKLVPQFLSIDKLWLLGNALVAFGGGYLAARE